ncbi:MAG: hypothetical protein JST54_08775 [Deltaproteobacteria bacterium]|nr:hypothetical protein [Deltaproteobacteria bacterium]
MIWGFIKLCAFVTLALITGVFCATVPIGGKTIATRAQALWAEPEVKRQVGVIETRAKRGVAAAMSDDPRAKADERESEEAPTPHSTKVDPHAVAKVVTDAPPGDDFRPSEKQAVQHLIQERARQAAHRTR